MMPGGNAYSSLRGKRMMGEVHPNTGSRKSESACLVLSSDTPMMCALRDHVDPGVGFFALVWKKGLRRKCRIPIIKGCRLTS